MVFQGGIILNGHNMRRVINNDDLMNTQKVHERDEFYDIKIISLGAQSDGISKLPNGITVIIKDKTLRVGQLVDIQITNVKDKFVFAKLI